MVALCDADVLAHEIGWSSEFRDKETGEAVLFDFERAAELLDDKIKLIKLETGSDKAILFISDNEWLAKKQKREFIPNYRYEVAKTKPYKGTRVNPKPFHFYNLLAYMLGNYEVVVSKDGYEADDEISIHQYSHWSNGQMDTIICSRDKDLRICPGKHYSWECGNQGSIGPIEVDRLGFLKRYEEASKTLGYGLAFFFYQMLVGDPVDNISGLPGCGDVYARNLLEGFTTEEDLYQRVKQAYKDKLGPDAKRHFIEQSRLLWIAQERGKFYVPNS